MSEEIYYDQNVYNAGDENPNSGKKGFAIASLVLGIISLLCCCCGLSYVTAPLSIIFGVIALIKGHGGKAMSIVGIVISAISVLILIISTITYGPFIKDYLKFAANAEEVITEYNETGELPDYIDKYSDSKYDDFWQSSGYDDFYDFFDDLVSKIEVTESSSSNNAVNEVSLN